jgi:hypothetical protein
VEQFRAIAGFFESSLGALVGRALEDGIRWTFGVDLSFVRSATTATQPEPVLAVA